VPVSRLLAVGVGAPGAVDPAHGVVKALAPNLKGWNEVPVASLLRRAVGAPVFVDNDVNLAILGERWKGVARGHDTCAFITVGTGIGAGIIVKGELHHGYHFQAGEIALMCMGPQFVESDFGARGCLETLVGLKALEARWTRHASSEGEPGAKGLIEAAQAGDRKARSILDETVTLIGIAAANLTLTLDPSLIVLGGAFITQAPHTIDEIRRIVARIVLTPSGIMQSTLGESAPLWGSVLLAMSEARQRLRTQLKNGR
jgi:predicted NBD/HSP70 family sugar kinase